MARHGAAWIFIGLFHRVVHGLGLLDREIRLSGGTWNRQGKDVIQLSGRATCSNEWDRPQRDNHSTGWVMAMLRFTSASVGSGGNLRHRSR